MSRRSKARERASRCASRRSPRTAPLARRSSRGANYGTCSGGYEPSDYTPATIAVETTATRFKVSVRHTIRSHNDIAGVAIFRAMGFAP